MRNTRLAVLAGTALLFVAVRLSANQSPVPPFHQCPQAGMALGCSYLLVFGPNGSTSLLFDPHVKDVDDKEAILVGLQNNSGSYLSLLDYKGTDNVFSGIHLTGGLGDGKSTYIVAKDSFESGDGDNEHDDDEKHVTSEPGSLVLLGTGLVVLGGILRRTAVRLKQDVPTASDGPVMS